MARPEILTPAGPAAGGLPADSGRQLRCPLCGKSFAADAMACHVGCPIAKRCRVLCCPHCGYEFPDEEGTRRRLQRFATLLQRVFGRRR